MFLRAAVMSHADIEDSLLRPAIQEFLPKPARSADGTSVPTDHEAIDAGLSRVLIALDVAEARRLLLDTVAAARRHFLKEETFVFAVARRQLSDSVQEELGAEWARLRGVGIN